MGSASTPRVFGAYEVLEILGEGGMGVVYRARHIALRREVALKLMREVDPGDTEGLLRFDRESRIHLGLNHPNLVKVFDAGVEKGQPYMAMEIIQGSSLRGVLDAQAPLAVAECREILLDLARALEYLHRRGVVHRDLKPENVLCVRGGVRKITDFGLSRRPDDTQLTEDGAFLGTLAFAAPEAVLGHPASPAADLYAMGLMAYWMLTGELAYEGESMEEWCVKIVDETPVPPSRKNPAVPAALDQWVMSLLAKYPEQRPTASALLSFLESGSLDAPAPPPIVRTPPRTSGRIAREKPSARTEILAPPAARGKARARVVAAAVILVTMVLARLAPWKETPPREPSPAASTVVAPSRVLGLLELETVATATTIHLRARTAEPVRLRLHIKGSGEDDSVIDEPTARSWHRHDIPVSPGRLYAVSFGTTDAAIRFDPDQARVRSLTTAEMQALVRRFEKERGAIPAPGSMSRSLMRITDTDPSVFMLMQHQPVLHTGAGESSLVDVTAGQTFSHVRNLVHLLGNIDGERTGRLLAGSLDPDGLRFEKRDRYGTFYERADRIVEALLRRGDDASVEAVRRFCEGGEERWTGTIEPTAMRFLRFVRYRSLRLLATYRPDVAHRIPWTDSKRHRECAAYLDAYLDAGTAAVERVRRSDEEVRMVTLAGLLERREPPPYVTLGTDAAWKDLTPEVWRLAGPLLAWQDTDKGLETMIAVARSAQGSAGRIAAATGHFLGLSRRPQALPALLELLGSTDEGVRLGALHGLALRAAAGGLSVPPELPRDVDPGILDRARLLLDQAPDDSRTRGFRTLCRVLWGCPGAREGLDLLAKSQDLLDIWAEAVTRSLMGEKEFTGALARRAADPATSVTTKSFEREGLANMIAALPGLFAPAHPDAVTTLVLLDPLPPWTVTGITLKVGDRIRVAYCGAARMERRSGDDEQEKSEPAVELPAKRFWMQARVGLQQVAVDQENQHGHRAMIDFVARDAGPLRLRTGFEMYFLPDELLTHYPQLTVDHPTLALARIEVRPAPEKDQPPGPSAPR